MRTLAIQAIFEDGSIPTDGSAPLVIQSVNLTWPQWTDGTIDITAVGANGLPFDITGGAFIFTARTRNQAAPPVISREAINDTNSTAHLIIGSADVGIAVQTLAWNLEFIDSLGAIWATTAQGSFAISENEYTPGQEVTVPPAQVPLGQGPNFGHSDTFTDFPDPTTKAWLGWIADDTPNKFYYSNGTAWVLAGSVGASGPVIEWFQGTPWSTIQPIALLAGDCQIIPQADLARSTPCIVTAGLPVPPGVTFIGSLFSEVRFAAGATLGVAADGYYYLQAVGGLVTLLDSVTPANSPVVVAMSGVDFQYEGVNNDAFPSCADQSFANLVGGIARCNVANNASGTGCIFSLASGANFIMSAGSDTALGSRMFKGPGTVQLYIARASERDINPAFIASDVTLSITNEPGTSTKLRFADGPVVANMPVMVSTTSTHFGRKAWDGVSALSIIGVSATAGTDGRPLQVVESRGQVATYTSDGAASIGLGVRLNFSTLVTGRVTTVGSGSDSGVFACWSQGTATATPGTFIFGSF